jgi:hypothetical protein
MKTGDKQTEQKFHRTLMDDLRQGGFRRTLRQDLKDIYDFYIDKETHLKLKKMRRLRRWLRLTVWLFKGLFYKLPRVRRVLFVFSLILFLFSPQFQSSDLEFMLDFKALGFIMMVLILMLELKDKLLAQDELVAGRTVQSALLPRDHPAIPGWDVWMITQPANEVGGDLVDYLSLDLNRTSLVLGDVAGKGLGAALYMAKLQATYRALAPGFKSLKELGKAMNTIFCRDGVSSRFISMVYVEVSSGSGKVRLLNAGHLPPLLITKGGVTETAQGAAALGLTPDTEYAEQSLSMEPGDMLFVFSDGLTEARNSSGEFFGEKRVVDMLQGSDAVSAAELGSEILETVQQFTGHSRPSDDLSLIIMKRVPR